MCCMIAVYGDNCIDRYTVQGDFVGGNAVNVAVHLADQGAQVAYFGITGDDAEGGLVRKALTAAGVDCTPLEVRSGQTAVTWIEVRDGERFVLDDYTGVQCPLRLSKGSLDILASYHFVH